jgi:sugar/nucleoside kinase (ribokinase family)
MSTTPYDIVVMGDINLDWACPGNLSFTFTSLISNGIIEWRQIAEVPGGSGLNFASFARQAGFHPLLLGKLGRDPAGEFLQRWLDDNCLNEGISFCPASTGKAFIVRDQQDIRFLVNNTPNANSWLSEQDVEQHTQAIQNAKFLYISGYCIMDLEALRLKATQRAIQLAHQSQSTLIIFDVVPHHIYNILSFEHFRSLTGKIHILVSEVATIRRFLGLGDRSERITSLLVDETIEQLKPYYPAFILRYGPSGCDQQAIWNGKDLIFEDTHHSQASDKRGYGDQLTIRSLMDVYGIRPDDA